MAATQTQLVLDAQTAGDLMTENPVSIREDATLPEAVALFVDKGISAAPVIDEAGLPRGVISRADILIHERELASRRHSESAAPGPYPRDEGMRVRDVMTPAVFSLRVDAPAIKVVQEMVALNVHRLFVVDEDGSLVGVISALDIVRRLR
jgi:CBS domain-containing protein